MVSVTDIIASYRVPVDWDKKAKEVAKKNGVTKDDILKEWEENREKALAKGVTLHKKKQKELEQLTNVINYEYQPGVKENYKPEDYLLQEGMIYCEKPFINLNKSIIGIPDKVWVENGFVFIDDYKTDKEIHNESMKIFTGKMFKKKKLTGCLSHIDDCNRMRYTIQLGLYMWLIINNNPKLRPGKMRLLHSKINEETMQIDSETEIKIPYLKKEILQIIKTI